MQPTFLSTFDRESRYPIFITFCECLSIAEIIFLTQTCKKLSGLYQYLLPIQWDVDKALRRFVGDPLGLRSQMAKHDALIIGYFAIQYFERDSREVDDTLDIVVQQAGSDLLGRYISEVEGYSEVEIKKFRPDELMLEVLCHAVKSILVVLAKFLLLQSRSYKKNADSNIEVLLFVTPSWCPPARSILHNTCTTAALNIIAWNKAYSLFPLPTLIQHKCYLLQDCDESSREAIRTHSRRGWNVQGVMWPEEQRHNHPIRERRRVGDRYTWMIPFDTRRVEWSKTPDYVLEHACFKINNRSADYSDDYFYDYETENVRNYTIKAKTLSSKVLKHTYTYGGDELSEFLAPRLHSSTVFELRKLSPPQRPANYDRIMESLADVDTANVEFDRPASWTYRDDEFPTWYQAFEKHRPERSAQNEKPEGDI